MISVHVYKRILELKEADASDSEIARTLGIHRTTVGKYLKNPGIPKLAKRAGRTHQDKLEPFLDSIAKDVEQCTNTQELFEDYLQRGYLGSYRTLCRKVAELKSLRPKERYFEQVHEPGKQAQFDFKEKIKIPFRQGTEIVHLHFGTLPCSGHFDIRAYRFRNFQCFAHGIVSFYKNLGGLTDELRIDNLTPCVKEILKGNGRVLTDAFQRFVDHLNIKPSICAPAKGNEKGDVEREIRSQAARILNRIRKEGLVFENLEELNSWLSAFCEARQRNKEGIEAEKKSLRSLPRIDDEVSQKILEVVPSKLGVICIERSRYSVPDTLIGVSCTAIVCYDKVHIVPQSDMGARHIGTIVHRRQIAGNDSILLEHCIKSLTRKPGAMLAWKHRQILFPSEIFNIYYEYLKRIKKSGADKEYLESLNLIHNAPLSEIGAGMELVFESKSTAPYADLKNLLLGYRIPQKALDQPKLNLDLKAFNSLIPT